MLSISSSLCIFVYGICRVYHRISVRLLPHGEMIRRQDHYRPAGFIVLGSYRAFSFLLLFYINNGTVRFYTIFGLCGWILYIVILSSLL